MGICNCTQTVQHVVDYTSTPSVIFRHTKALIVFNFGCKFGSCLHHRWYILGYVLLLSCADPYLIKSFSPISDIVKSSSFLASFARVCRPCQDTRCLSAQYLSG